MDKILISFILFISLTSCNYTITMVHTEGQASDLIDETSSSSPSTSFSLPIK